MPRTHSAALPLAHIALRILVIVNWVVAAGIIVLLFITPHEQWLMHEFNLTPSPDTTRLVMGMRAVAVLGLVSTPLNHVILKRLLAIVGTVRAGDPFVLTNAQRLQTIAWMVLVLQFISIAIGAIGDAISSPAHRVNFSAGFSANGWLAVLLFFVLARVFAEGARMRDDLEGTV